MLDCPARMNTLSGLAYDSGEKTQSSAAARILVGFIGNIWMDLYPIGIELKVSSSTRSGSC
jgi:hypothetical protein